MSEPQPQHSTGSCTASTIPNPHRGLHINSKRHYPIMSAVRYNPAPKHKACSPRKSVVIALRNQKVILDSDVVDLYDVQTEEINQGVRNNPRKFPEGYVFELTDNEKTEVVKIFDHLQKLRFSLQLLKAFTEKGLYMLAAILKSDQAVDTTIAIVEAYAKLKELIIKL